MIRISALLGMLSGLLFTILLALDPNLFGTEWLFYDAATRSIAKRTAGDPDIVILTIDETSIETLEEGGYGRPPYSRELMAMLLDELQRGGARLVIFDILFTEAHVADSAGDRSFADAMTRVPVVLAAYTDPEQALFKPPIDMFRRAAAGVGTVRLATDEEKKSSVAREYLFGDDVGRETIPSLAVDAARVLGRRAEGRGRFLIRWHSEESYPRMAFEDRIVSALLRNELTPEQIEVMDRKLKEAFDGKIVFVGYTAAGLFDLRATPLSPAAAGVEIHANALDTLLHGSANRRASEGFILTLIVIATTLFGAILGATRSQPLSAALLLATLAAWLLGAYAALSRGIAIPAIAPSLAAIAAFIAITTVKYFAEQKLTRELKLTFGRYVSPQILVHILAHPEKVELGGERRDMTILFSDIRGFTSISEASEPEEVVEMLNEYLTQMVEILLRHGGTLDKFIGDAVMGFWNAPTIDPDHAQHAVDCAIEMVNETARLRQKWSREGKAAIRIGIGINTGEAVVGNIGSRQVFGYTVIGDAVNLASRLEGTNKEYGTEIIISDATRERIRSDIAAVYLGEVKVKGKEKAVKIYEIKGTPG